jgi:hypothetical protein
LEELINRWLEEYEATGKVEAKRSKASKADWLGLPDKSAICRSTVGSWGSCWRSALNTFHPPFYCLENTFLLGVITCKKSLVFPALPYFYSFFRYFFWFAKLPYTPNATKNQRASSWYLFCASIPHQTVFVENS